MTSHHLLLWSRTWRAIAFGALIVLSQFFLTPAAQAKGQPPEQAAAQFYRWYLQSLAISQDPLRQSPVQLSVYVSKQLISELKRRMNGKGLRADYFIQAQESMDDWATDIKTVRPTIQGNMATVVVVLGATEETRRRLALTLTRADGDWKICTVRLAKIASCIDSSGALKCVHSDSQIMVPRISRAATWKRSKWAFGNSGQT